MSNDSNENLIPMKDWGKIVASFEGNNIPMPFVKEIFLIDCSIAGTVYVAGIRERTERLPPGALLTFRREPKNPYDELAILIFNDKSEKLGYIPRSQNEVLARLMDGGKQLFGRVEEKWISGDRIHISIKVFLRDL